MQISKKVKLIIVGLGNPGKKYQKTRHNVGAFLIDQFPKKKRGFILVKPQVYMNESGKVVKKLIKNLKLNLENLIVVHDDIDIPLGEFKIQKGRGAAGHKGVESIIKELGTKDFWRIRIGICPKNGKPKSLEKFVLQKFTKKEEKKILKVIKKIISFIVF